MIERKHSPGPWETVLQDDPRGQPVVHYPGLVAIIEASPDRRLSVVLSEDRRVSRDELEANARLIAAAPDLLRACIKALAVMHQGVVRTTVAVAVRKALDAEYGVPEART